MGLHKHHPANIKRRLQAMHDRWDRDSMILTELGFNHHTEDSDCFSETARNLETAIAYITEAIAMENSALNRHLTSGREGIANETADALFGPVDVEMAIHTLVNGTNDDDEPWTESCPECKKGKLLTATGGGVKCNFCWYWFCY